MVDTSKTMCKKCALELSINGYCKDSVCPYSDWTQNVAWQDLEEIGQVRIEKK